MTQDDVIKFADTIGHDDRSNDAPIVDDADFHGLIVREREDLHLFAVAHSAECSARYIHVNSVNPLFCDHIDLAIKRVAKIVSDFGHIEIEQQISNPAEATLLISNAHPELTAVLVFIR